MEIQLINYYIFKKTCFVKNNSMSVSWKTFSLITTVINILFRLQYVTIYNNDLKSVKLSCLMINVFLVLTHTKISKYDILKLNLRISAYQN